MKTDKQIQSEILKILYSFELGFRDADCKWFEGIDKRDFEIIAERIAEIIRETP